MLQASSVLVVGGGLTGSVASRALCRLLPVGSKVIVWEALDVIGGRFHTETTADGSGLCDTGAQYVTVTDDADAAAANAPLYDELTSAGILVPMRGRIEGGRAADGAGANYVAPAGLSSVVSHLFASSGVEPIFGRRAVRVATASSKWEVSSADGVTERFDGIILTQPLPEMLQLLDASDEPSAWLPEEDGTCDAGCLSRSAMRSIQYSSRYALTMFFPPEVSATFSSEIDWIARYITKAEDDAIVYLGHDSAKRQQGDHGGSASLVSLIVHTSVPYGLKKIGANAGDEEVTNDLKERVQKLLPWLPPPQSSVLRTWRVSQVRTPLALPGKAACWPLRPGGEVSAPPLILAGDAFAPLGSRFDGCVQSGEGAAEALRMALL